MLTRQGLKVIEEALEMFYVYSSVAEVIDKACSHIDLNLNKYDVSPSHYKALRAIVKEHTGIYLYSSTTVDQDGNMLDPRDTIYAIFERLFDVITDIILSNNSWQPQA